jgi:phosphoribosylglycinamide formyltransferase-1
MTHPLPVVVLLSGKGSNMRALAEAAARNEVQAEIRAVFSDRANADGLRLARERGIVTDTLSPKEFADRDTFDVALADRIDRYAPELVVLAGYMRILSAAFVRRFAGRLINIHPSLLPKHRGLDTHRRVLAANESEHGASVHYVVEELDAGPVIIQGRVPVLPSDDEAALSARVQRAEHIIYPQAVQWIASGKVSMHDGRAWMDGQPLSKPPRIDIPT